MAGRYSTTGTRSSSTTLSVVGMQCTTTTQKRLTFYDFVMGASNAPADNTFLWCARRITAAGTPAGGSAVTPQVLDTGYGAALFDATEGWSTDPTISAEDLLAIPLNHRATFRWVAAPGSEIVTPATDNLGLAWMTPTPSPAAITVTVTSLCIE